MCAPCSTMKTPKVCVRSLQQRSELCLSHLAACDTSWTCSWGPSGNACAGRAPVAVPTISLMLLEASNCKGQGWERACRLWAQPC